MDNKKIGRLIAKKRKEKGLTQSGLAELLSVSNKTISKWETGAGLPDISLLIDLSNVLDISIDDLLKGKDKENISVDYQKSFLVKKDYYKQYLIDHYFQNQFYWLMDLVAFMMILCGLFCIPLNFYISSYMDIIGKIFIFIGIIILLMPMMKSIYLIHGFQEDEVYYSLKDDGILYRQNDETVFYYYSQLNMIKKKQFIILKKQKTILWLNLEDTDFIANHLKKQNNSYSKLKFILSLFLSIIVLSCFILQLGYLIVLKRFGFEYIHQQLEYIFYFIMICGMITIYMFFKRSIKQALISLFTSMIFIFVAFIVLSNHSIRVFDSFSPDFQNRAVLKYDITQKKLYEYHYTYLCFARKSDTTSLPLMINEKGYWVSNDCYVLTYEDANSNKQVYINTYGDRGNGISYFYVVAAMQGKWLNVNDGEKETILNVEKGEMTLQVDDTSYTFKEKQIQQNGTIALTLYQYDLPKYIIVLNENCQLDENNLINKKGTIQFIDVEDFSTVTLYCATYKEDKQEQQEIDDKMRQQAINLVNKMDNIIKNDSTLQKYEDNSSLFKLTSSSQDMFTVSKEAYFQYRKTFTDNSFEEKGQIKHISIIAGDIHDFYVEILYSSSMTYHGETEDNQTEVNYRIKQGKGCYLVGNIGYRVPGDVGLVKLDPAIEKDTSQDETYVYK